VGGGVPERRVDVLPPPDMANAAEVIPERFALRFWKIKVRKFFFAWFI
jgi:hypothetical protein